MIDAGLLASPAPPVVPVVPPPQSADVDLKPTSVSLKSALRSVEPPPIVPKPVLPKKAISFAAEERKKPPPLPDKPEYVKERATQQPQQDGFALSKTNSGSSKEEVAKRDDPPLPSRTQVPLKRDEPTRKEEDVTRELGDIQHQLAPVRIPHLCFCFPYAPAEGSP